MVSSPTLRRERSQSTLVRACVAVLDQLILNCYLNGFRLEDTYHYEDCICLPRSTIYEHYSDFCSRNQLQPVNAASFGKVMKVPIENSKPIKIERR